MHLPEKFNNTALSCSGSYYGLNQKQSSPLSWHMPPKKKKANQSRPVASSSSASDATTGSSISSDARAPALESSPLSIQSAQDPSAILRSLLSSEASAAARSLVAHAYMQCLLASSVPDELRTPAFIVLLGAKCPASRVDRLCTFSPCPTSFFYSAARSPMFRYLQLLRMPPPASAASAIDIDVPRTFKGDESFSSRVNPEMMRRVLYSYASYCHEQSLGTSYVQGLNTICGMLLYNTSELNAFFCLCAFTGQFAPAHYAPDIAGAHHAASCCDELLRHADMEVIQHRAPFILDEIFFPHVVERVAFTSRLLICGSCTSGNPGVFVPSLQLRCVCAHSML